MTKRSKFMMLGVLVIVGGGLAWLAIGALLNLLLFGKFHAPTTADYVLQAKSWEPVVVAIYDYRADHGGDSPKDFGDLVPAYLPKVPTGPFATISGSRYLLISTGAPHTGLVYSFDPKDEGWTVEGDFGIGKLPIPKLGPSKKPGP